MDLTARDPTMIIDASARIQNFWLTYSNQEGYQNYSLETFLNDALYGIGLAIDESKYREAQGFDQFKKELIEYLETQKCTR